MIQFLLVGSIVPQTHAQQPCSDNLTFCNATEMDIIVLEASTSDTCSTPDDTFVLDVTVLLDPQGNTQKYDVALWIPETSTADIDNLSSADQCFANLINPDGNNLDGDGCDDVDGSGGGSVKTTQSFILSCDWDNQLLALVTSWQQLGGAIPMCSEPTTTAGSECLALFGPVVSVEVCGDGVLDPSEECDDGNNGGGDGCDAMCQIEPSCLIEECFFQDGFELLTP